MTSIWYYRDVKNAPWVYEIRPNDLLELDTALRHHKKNNTEKFSLPFLEITLKKIEHDLIHGRGFALLRGLPISHYGEENSEIISQGITRHFGQIIPQNIRKERVVHVMDTGESSEGPFYRTQKAIPFHTDTADIVCLLCLSNAKQGGLSRLVSSVTIYNEIILRYPHLTDQLHSDFYIDLAGNTTADQPPYAIAKIFNCQEMTMINRYHPGYIIAAQNKYPEIPRLSDLQKELLRIIDELADNPELHFEMELNPGDMQFINNNVIFHSRTAFQDSKDQKRHLLRIWIDSPFITSLTSIFGDWHTS